MNTTRKAAALLCSAAAAAAVLASAAPSRAAAAPVKAAVVAGACFPAYTYQFIGNGVNIHQRPFTGSAGGAILGPPATNCPPWGNMGAAWAGPSDRQAARPELASNDRRSRAPEPSARAVFRRPLAAALYRIVTNRLPPNPTFTGICGRPYRQTAPDGIDAPKH